MFGLIRWLLLLLATIALVGAIVTVRVNGTTPAEGVCRLWGNPRCLWLADRVAANVRAAERRFGLHLMPFDRRESPRPLPRPRPALAPAPTPSGAAAHGPSGAAAQGPSDAAAQGPSDAAAQGPTASPLDRHTATERQALNRILERGSR